MVDFKDRLLHSADGMKKEVEIRNTGRLNWFGRELNARLRDEARNSSFLYPITIMMEQLHWAVEEQFRRVRFCLQTTTAISPRAAPFAI